MISLADLDVYSMRSDELGSTAAASNIPPKTPDKSGSFGLPLEFPGVSSQNGSSRGSDLEHYNYLRADLTPSHITQGPRRSVLTTRAADAIKLGAKQGYEEAAGHFRQRKRIPGDYTEHVSSKRSRRVRKHSIGDFDYIGHHKLEPRLKVVARMSINAQGVTSVMISAFKNDSPAVPQDILDRWSDLVTHNGYVARANVLLDPKLFAAYGEVINDLTEEKMSEVIKLYLSSVKRSLKATKTAGPDALGDPDFGRTKVTGPYLLVGVEKDNPKVRVYAFNAVDRSLLFKRDMLDASAKAKGYSVKYEMIRFNKEFDKGGANPTKNYIRFRLCERAPNGN